MNGSRWKNGSIFSRYTTCCAALNGGFCFLLMGALIVAAHYHFHWFIFKRKSANNAVADCNQKQNLFETVKSNNSRNGSLVSADDDAASVCDLMGGMRG